MSRLAVGLVQQQDAGIQGDADGQAGPAHLPAGHEAAVPVLQLRQPEPLQQLRGAPLPLRDVPYLHGVGDVPRMESLINISSGF